MSEPALTMDRGTWLLLVLLSVLWGASFFFIGTGLRELPPLTVVLARVAFGALGLLPFFKLLGGTLPKTLGGWMPFFVMSMFNNVIAFILLAYGQTYVSSGLAAVLNATTPLFSVLVLGAFGDERFMARRVIRGADRAVRCRGAARARPVLTAGSSPTDDRHAAVPGRGAQLRFLRPLGPAQIDGRRADNVGDLSAHLLVAS